MYVSICVRVARAAVQDFVLHIEAVITWSSTCRSLFIELFYWQVRLRYGYIVWVFLQLKLLQCCPNGYFRSYDHSLARYLLLFSCILAVNSLSTSRMSSAKASVQVFGRKVSQCLQLYCSSIDTKLFFFHFRKQRLLLPIVLKVMGSSRWMVNRFIWSNQQHFDTRYISGVVAHVTCSERRDHLEE